MPITQNLFTGMDMDSAYSLRDNKKYFKLQNGELVVDDELGTGTISNTDGNLLSFVVPASIADPTTKGIGPSTNHIIIGAGTAGDYVILFTTSSSNLTPSGGSGNIGAVWAFKYNNTSDLVTGILPGSFLDPTVHMVFYDKLNFATEFPIRMVGNAESDEVIKVYFTDGYNTLRQINILEDDILDEDLDHIEIIENISFSQPTSYVINGGVFMPGSVQYAFQMFSYNGAETKFSPPSPIINISNSDYSSSDTSDFLGSEYIEDGDPTNKAVRVTVPDLDYDYDYIRIVRIFYRTEYSSPDITIVAELGITDGSQVSFIDNGDITLGSYTHQEFASMGGVLFSAEDIAVSNNRLIAANIQESYYNPDFDARGYRFSAAAGTNEARIESSSSSSDYYLIQPNGNWQGYGAFAASSGTNFEIPEDADCVNPDQDTYKYQADGLRLGGEGANVSYSFNLESLIIDDSKIPSHSLLGTTVIAANSLRNHYAVGNFNKLWSSLGNGYIDSDGYSNYASDVTSAQMAGYQRDETYRFGVVFFDIKGRTSFTSWIGDIKMPKVSDTDSAVTYVDISSGSAVNRYDFGITTCEYIVSSQYAEASYANILGLDFTISNVPDDAVSYQIVRVERGDEDKTVIASGIFTPTFRGIGDSISRYKVPGSIFARGTSGADIKFVATGEAYNFGRTLGTGETYSDLIYNFFSPEVSFYKNINTNSTSLHVNGKITGNYHTEIIDEDGDFPMALFYKAMHVEPLADVIISNDDGKIITKETGLDNAIPGITDSTYEYHHIYNESHSGSSATMFCDSQGGSGFVGVASSSISTAITAYYPTTDMIGYGLLKRENSSAYNGNTYEARKSNKYIKASMLNNISDLSISVFGGDTFIGMFDHTRVYHISGGDRNMDNLSSSDHSSKTSQSICVYPVETTVNLDWRNDRSYCRLSGNRYLLKEEKGSHELGDEIFNQETDSYLLNYAYIRENNSTYFYEEPTFFDKLTTNLTHRLMASEAKYDGEMSDSWLKFKPNNILDVDGTSGPINAIEAISEHLYYFQDTSIGVTRIDERALVNDTEGVSLVLGTGDIFGKPRSVSDHEGTVQTSSIIRGRNAIYFYDTINTSIAAIGQNGATDISRLKGVRSYIKSHVGEDLLNGSSIANGYGVYSGFNPNTGMVYFTFKNTTLSAKGQFTIGYSEIVNDFVSFYSFIPIFYISDKNRFITIQLSSNDDGWIHKGGNKCDFYGTTYDTVITPIITDNSSITKVFDAIEYVHDADESGGGPPVALDTFTKIRAYNNFLDTGHVDINAKFRFRTWRAKMPRFIESTKKKRIMGKYLKVDLTFDNDANKDLFLQPVLISWRPMVLIET